MHAHGGSLGSLMLSPLVQTNDFHLSIILAEKGCEYKFDVEFRPHEPEFDYLKSLEIEAKINKMKWCK
jgi:hypothetical protein